MKKRKNGFTIIEIVVFVGVFSFSIVYILSAVLYTSNSMKQSQIRTIASHENGELTEWLLYKRNFLAYSGFIDEIWPLGDTGNAKTYCFNDTLDESAIWPDTEGLCTSYDLNNQLKREAVFTLQDTIAIDITTSWQTTNSISTLTSTIYIADY